VFDLLKETVVESWGKGGVLVCSVRPIISGDVERNAKAAFSCQVGRLNEMKPRHINCTDRSFRHVLYT